MGYQEKQAKKTNAKHIKKSAFLLVALILILVVGAGTTLAYIVDMSGPLSNIFSPSNVACAVNDDKSIKNTGDVDAYIRAAVVVTWKDNAGNVYGQKPNVTITSESGWNKKADGYYYYNSSVAVGNKTAVLIKEYTLTGTEPDDYSLSIEIVAEAIQANPANAVESAWGVTVNSDGTISAP